MKKPTIEFGGVIRVVSIAFLTIAAARSGEAANSPVTAAAIPVFSLKAGTYGAPQTVSISDVTAGATIYYTTSGATPTTASAKYAAPIKVSESETLKAVAVADGFTESPVESAAYVIENSVATPTFSPVAGAYATAQEVSIIDSTKGATIYYTTDGSTPTTSSTKYSTPVKVTTTETLKAIAVASGYVNSAVTSATFTIHQQTATLTSLASFGGTSTSGTHPVAPLVQDENGKFYGTTMSGGAHGDGTIFEITTEGVVTTVYSFGSKANDGSGPASGLIIGSNGNLYGTTRGGGANNQGTIFQLTPSGILTTLHAFTGKDGALPTNLIQASDGDFYGATSLGGAHDLGAVFRMTPAGLLTTLFSFNGIDGSLPTAPLVQGPDGNFYGATDGGGPGFTGQYYTGAGTLFRITPSGSLTTLYTFNGTDGAAPDQGLVVGKDGDFYGTASSGGNGYTPITGGLYGTGYGVVFKLTKDGALTSLHRFSGTDGDNPVSSLLPGDDGNFYGTTYLGGTDGDGTVYEITPTGVFTSLYSFSRSNGYLPSAPLVQSSDGDFYGTTASGGTANKNILEAGTVFKFSVAP